MPRTHNSNDTSNIAHLQQQEKPLAELLDKKSLCEHLSISPRTIENMVNAGTFPPPVRIGKYVYWSEVAVSAWQRRMFSAQEAWTPT
ncbi:MAG: helix-turn-helix domain-containing protein [Denitromonas halophila]|nr:MAG: helix-turn-helix domain-containing protein [Denitromonas halophila]